MNKKPLAHKALPVTTASRTFCRKMIGSLSAGLYLFAAALPATAGEADALITPPTIADEDSWEFGMSINGWLPSISSTTFNGTAVDIDLGEVLESLNMVASKGRWFVGSDLLYMDLQSAVYNQRPIETIKTDIRMKSWVVTPIGGYTLFQGDWGQFDLFGGARYLYLGVDTRTFARGPLGGLRRSIYLDDSGSAWAGIVGFRGRINLSEKWFMPYYFDIGAGDEVTTIQAFAGIGYRLSRFDVTLGYRYLKWDLDAPAPMTDLEIEGPMLGLQFAF